jgi:hypothetical protein
MLELEFDSPEALLDWIKAEFQRTLSEGLEGVIARRIICVQKCIEDEGDYFPED